MNQYRKLCFPLFRMEILIPDLVVSNSGILSVLSSGVSSLHSSFHFSVRHRHPDIISTGCQLA